MVKLWLLLPKHCEICGLVHACLQGSKELIHENIGLVRYTPLGADVMAECHPYGGAYSFTLLNFHRCEDHKSYLQEYHHMMHR
jgi:hypothetical protein